MVGKVNLFLEESNFQKLVKVLSIIKDICTDADIKNGFLRQRLDEQFYTIEMNLTNIISDISLPIAGVKQILQLIKIFSSGVNLEVDETSFQFSDNLSSIRFESPVLEYLDNHYISEDDLISIYPINPDELVLECNISKEISHRIKTICSVFNTNTIQINFNGNEASIFTRTQAMDKKANILIGLPLNKSLEGTCKFVTTPFIINEEDIKMEVYLSMDNICITRMTSTVSDLPIVMFSRSNLKTDQMEF